MSERMEHITASAKTQLGFWLYLMTDCMLFASLFAVYVVSINATAGGPAAKDIYELPLVLTESILLLLSSFTCGLALIFAMRRKRVRLVLSFLAATFVLGASFLAIELYEFTKLISEGHSWQASAFLSAFFVLVGTHGLHIFIGLLWLVVLLILIARQSISSVVMHKLKLFTLFWHFLDLIWIFIFTVVYLMGVSL